MAGMPASLPAALNDGDDEFAIAIAEGDLRAQEVGTADVAAAEIGAVAAGAADAVQRLAARDLHGVAGRPLLAGHEASGGAARAGCGRSASGLAGRRCVLRRETRRHGKRQSKQSSDHLDPHRLPLKNQSMNAPLPCRSTRAEAQGRIYALYVYSGAPCIVDLMAGEAQCSTRRRGDAETGAEKTKNGRTYFLCASVYSIRSASTGLMDDARWAGR